jgi:Effector-associated domain 7
VQPTRLDRADFPRWDAVYFFLVWDAPCQPAGARLTQAVRPLGDSRPTDSLPITCLCHLLDTSVTINLACKARLIGMEITMANTRKSVKTDQQPTTSHADASPHSNDTMSIKKQDQNNTPGELTAARPTPSPRGGNRVKRTPRSGGTPRRKTPTKSNSPLDKLNQIKKLAFDFSSNTAPNQPRRSLSGQLRELLLKAFSDEELTLICSDYFPHVYNQLTQSIGRAFKAQHLAEYCVRQGLENRLLEIVKTENYNQYKDYVASQPTIQVQIRLSGNVASLDPSLLGAIVRMLGNVTGVPSDDIAINYTAFGSIILRLTLPEKAVDYLRYILEHRTKLAEDLRISEIRNLTLEEMDEISLNISLNVTPEVWPSPEKEGPAKRIN